MTALELWNKIHDYVDDMDPCSTDAEYQEGYCNARDQVNNMLMEVKEEIKE